MDAGEIGAGHSVTTLYEIRGHLDAIGRIATTHLRWQDPGGTKSLRRWKARQSCNRVGEALSDKVNSSNSADQTGSETDDVAEWVNLIQKAHAIMRTMATARQKICVHLHSSVSHFTCWFEAQLR